MEFAKKFFHLLPNPVWKEMRIRQEANLAKHEKTAFSNTQKNGMSPQFSPPLNIYSIFLMPPKPWKDENVRFSKWGQPLVLITTFLEMQWSYSNNMKKMLFFGRKGFLIPEKIPSLLPKDLNRPGFLMGWDGIRWAMGFSTTFLNAKWLVFQ